ncbi:MAG: MFS transporter, partial [Microvirgula sp.]
LAISMAAPMAVRTEMFHIGEDWQGDAAALSSRLSSQKGVKEAVVIASERVAYLKVMQNDWDRASVNKLIEETY